MQAGYQGREVGCLFHVIGIGLGAVLGVHGLQLLLAPVLHDGGCIAVAEHVVRGSEPVTVGGRQEGRAWSDWALMTGANPWEVSDV